MNNRIHFLLAALLLALAPVVLAVEPKVSALKGTVTKIDQAAKTIVVKTADGTEHTLQFVKRTAVHGVTKTAEGAKDAFHGLQGGSEVVVHYSEKGGKATAEEVDHIGKGGLQASEGTIASIDRNGKTMVVKTEDGTEQTYRLASHATVDAGRDIAAGAEKSQKVTVYYSQQAGHKVAHFFEKNL